MKYLDLMQFTPATIQRQEYEFLVEYTKRNNIKSVLEFGPGCSTYAFKENDCYVLALEHTDWFFEHFRKQFARDKLNVILSKYGNETPVFVPENLETKFDMAFIDSPPGISGTSQKPFNRLNTCMYAAKHTKRILLHDSFRIGERLTQMFFDQIGWRVLDICLDGYGICEMTYGLY